MTKNAEKKARAMLSRLSLEQLIKEFDMTEDMPASFELSMVRGDHGRAGEKRSYGV